MLELSLLFVAAFTAAAVSGIAGFGGALLLLPALVAAIGVTKAVPLLTIVQLIGNLSRASFGFKQITWKPVKLFLVAAIPMSVVGAMSFVQLPKELITRAIGAIILIFLALEYFGALKIKAGPVLLITGGAVVGFVSGLVGSAGPLGAAIFLTLKLAPLAYIASDAITSVVMHGVKIAVYQHFIDFDQQFWVLAVALGGAMVLGTWAGKRVVERMSRKRFRWLVAILLVLNAAYMLIHG